MMGEKPARVLSRLRGSLQLMQQNVPQEVTGFTIKCNAAGGYDYEIWSEGGLQLTDGTYSLPYDLKIDGITGDIGSGGVGGGNGDGEANAVELNGDFTADAVSGAVNGKIVVEITGTADQFNSIPSQTPLTDTIKTKISNL